MNTFYYSEDHVYQTLKDAKANTAAHVTKEPEAFETELPFEVVEAKYAESRQAGDDAFTALDYAKDPDDLAYAH